MYTVHGDQRQMVVHTILLCHSGDLLLELWHYPTGEQALLGTISLAITRSPAFFGQSQAVR